MKTLKPFKNRNAKENIPKVFSLCFSPSGSCWPSGGSVRTSSLPGVSSRDSWEQHVDPRCFLFFVIYSASSNAPVFSRLLQLDCTCCNAVPDNSLHLLFTSWSWLFIPISWDPVSSIVPPTNYRREREKWKQTVKQLYLKWRLPPFFYMEK